MSDRCCISKSFRIVKFYNISFSQKQGSFSFGLSDLDVRKPLSSEANIGYFLTDDVMVSLSMDNWDNYAMSTRYYCCEDKFIQATTTSNGSGNYTVGAGGAAKKNQAVGAQGSSSVFASITS